MGRCPLVLALAIAATAPGCAQLAVERAPSLDTSEEVEKACNGAAASPAKVLLEWKLGPEAEDEGDEDEEQPLAADRPDFVEASSNVGLGRVQLEMGYTFTRDRESGVTTRNHSYPEALLRIGIFADWLELRIGQNLGTELTDGGGANTSDSGAEDLYLGLGVGLTEQKGIFPESRIVFQARIPTGCNAFTDRHFLPGMNYLYGWDVIPDKVTVGMSSQVNRAQDETGHEYTEFAQAATTGITLTKKLGIYLETYGIFPSGAVIGFPEYYFDSGLIYRVNNNLQFDVRAGVGLNQHADDFFVGSGFSVRF